MKTLTMLSIAGALAFAVPALASGSSSVPSPEKQCRAERAGMGKALFAKTYGTNHDRSNAFGKCVSKRTRATNDAKDEAHKNASKECAAERSADPAAFKAKYGTNHNGANAFGKCVSSKAKAEARQETSDEVDDDISAAKSCKSERAANPSAFVKKYGTRRNAFGKCVSHTAKDLQDESDGS
jgi:hypothetical protein